MKSMTGFGVARGRVDGRLLSVEARSVNHRYAEVTLRFPPRYAVLEPEVVKLVRRRFERGKFDLFLREEWVRADEEEVGIARRSFRLLRKIQKSLKLSGPIALSDLLTFRGLQSSRGASEVSENTKKTCLKLILQALEGLAKMREREGAHLKVWFDGRLRRMEKTLKSVELKLRKRELKRRGEKLPEIDAGTDRGDVTEELVRLQSHVRQFEHFLRSPEAIGRKLDFLSQEMLRELNTLGAKVEGVRPAHQVIELKSEMEKIREQVQNIE